MPITTDRYAFPLLSAAQAQKEVTHNAALTAIDGLIQASVLGISAAPPQSPNAGDAWVVAAAATGAWAQHSGQIAFFTAGTWTFLSPQAGCAAWNRADGAQMIFDGTAWRTDAWPARPISIAGNIVVGAQQPAIASPSGGSVVDQQARAVLGQLLAAVRAHGLIGS